MKRVTSQGRAGYPVRCCKNWLFAALLLTQPVSQAVALGLGDMQYSSYLGDVLNAEIKLISRGEDYGLDQVAVRQIGERRAAELGIELISSRYQFDFKPVLENGEIKVRIKSRQVVTEPFINLLVELQWPKGSVYREYTFLLDPAPARPDLSGSAEKSSADTAVTNKPGQAAAKPPNRTVKTSGSRSPSTATDLKPGERYRVQPGDTLSGIAGRWAATSAHSRQATMNWLFENNPNAFVRGDINRLRAGVEMILPKTTSGALSQTPAPVARQNVQQEAISDEPASVNGVADEAPQSTQEGVVRLTNPEVMTVDDLRKMNLTDATAKAMQSHIDATREVIDKLTRDNDDMRERLQNIEDSEYLELLKQLVIAQKQQIDELRRQARELAGMDDGTSLGGSALPVAESVADGARAVDAETVVIESKARNTAVEVNSTTGRALEQGAGTLNPWLAFFTALWVPVLLVGGFLLWRKRNADNGEERVAINTLLESEEKALSKRRQAAQDKYPPPPDIRESETLKANMQTVLDKGLDINPEDAEFLMGGDIQDLPDDIDALDEQSAPSDYRDINRELMEAFELNEDPDLQAELESLGRRPDEQVKAGIREKTQGYKPSQPEFGEYSFDDADEFELEIDPEALADDLDEVTFVDVPEVDETDDIIQKALIYTTYGRYNEAEALLLNQEAAIGKDSRITEALADVRELKEKDKDL